MDDENKKYWKNEEEDELTPYAKKKFKKFMCQLPYDGKNEHDMNISQSYEGTATEQYSRESYDLEAPDATIEALSLNTQVIKLSTESADLSGIEGLKQESITPLEKESLCSSQESSLYQTNSHLCIQEDVDVQMDDVYVTDDFFEINHSSDEELIIDVPEGREEYPHTIDELKNKEGFLQCISASVERSLGELLLMSLTFALTQRLTFTGITNLMQFVNRIYGDKILPETRFAINKLFNPKNNFTLHATCNVCSNYLGKFEEFNKKIVCENCGNETDVSNRSNSCFFALINPSESISDCLQTHESDYEFILKERLHEPDLIKDIFDGDAYRNFQNKLSPSDRYNYVTVTFNTDGAPVFKSSKYSIWPIYLMVNEVNVEYRPDCLFEAGLWFGKNKPEMQCFLEQFVNEFNELSEVGIPCKIKGEDRNIKVFAILASVDTVARAPMNGTIQFNGYYGCDWCEHPGQYYNGSMKYPFIFPFPSKRSHECHIRYAQEALNTDTVVLGVKYASPLLNLKHFDIITGFTPEYMHCFVAGVVQQFIEYLLSKLSKDDIDILDNIVLNMKVPHQVCRLSRSVKDRAYWKAREWENWLLYYSLPALTCILKEKTLLKHWSLLVDSLHICLKAEITYFELNHANELLHEFVSKAAELYSLKVMTYNLHQLLHIAESIMNWGPLWAHSAFAFESANLRLLTSIQCAKGVILQIIRYANLHRSPKVLQKIVYPNSLPFIISYIESLPSSNVNKFIKLNAITYLGKGKPIDENTSSKYNVSRATKSFSKMVAKGSLFRTSKKINQRSCNYYARLKTEKFIKITNFLVDIENNNAITICKDINTRRSKLSNAIHEIVSISIAETTVTTDEISKSCVYIKCNNNSYIIPLPNMYFY